MPSYIDVGVVRIQEYILRTSGAAERQLRRRRGASRMIAAATDPSRFAALGLIPNDETYTVEGVVHLKTASETEPAQALAMQAMAALRMALPQAYLNASWASAETYELAHDHMRRARERRSATPLATVGACDSLPPFRDDPYGGRCPSCGLAPAHGDSDCADCRARADAGAQFEHTGAATPESRALAGVEALLFSSLSPVKDIAQLVNLTADPDVKSNHTATIYADGNRVGSLFAGIEDLGLAKDVSVSVDAAIRAAGVNALADLCNYCEPGVLPGIVTLLAADDCLITVPAPLAWRFTNTLVESFTAAMRASAAVCRATGSDALPSLTAGIAFAHEKSPIETAIQAAADAMASAKTAHPGGAAVGWIDLTQPDVDPTNSGLIRPSVSAEWLAQNGELLDSFAQVPRSQLAAWERDIRDAHMQGLSDEEVGAYLARQTRRLGLHGVASEAHNTPSVMRILSLVRWWRTPRRSEELSKGGQP